ncbi:MarR family winged helix-turn-helix transcriptional regulator [Mycetocola sp. JXN-3]|uniref:MarR family winged helix-turn-helix transcriptional regulator n=1 Tax=Mycetocola sp. JXN-3 TaxID=2116510 RepID=UPI002104BC8F|nr:MarR family transcriptional regulator [Mycetocola sp. JXN-3]
MTGAEASDSERPAVGATRIPRSGEAADDGAGAAAGGSGASSPGTGPVAVLRALRRWRERDEAMRRETRREMGMGETDMAALRFLIAAAGRSEPVTGKRLADHLGISSASTTKLTDRLVASGHLRRLPHPVDRRAILLEASAQTHREVRGTLSGRHERMLAAAESLTSTERAAVVRFLDRIGESIGPDVDVDVDVDAEAAAAISDAAADASDAAVSDASASAFAADAHTGIDPLADAHDPVVSGSRVTTP